RIVRGGPVVSRLERLRRVDAPGAAGKARRRTSSILDGSIPGPTRSPRLSLVMGGGRLLWSWRGSRDLIGCLVPKPGSRSLVGRGRLLRLLCPRQEPPHGSRSEEHTSELQSLAYL